MFEQFVHRGLEHLRDELGAGNVGLGAGDDS